MTYLPLAPPLGLALLFFTADEERSLRSIIGSVASPQLPWRVVDRPPYHACLMARGTRHSDPAEFAVLRLSHDAERAARTLYGDAMAPMALRKPLQPARLRVALEMVAANLIPEHMDGLTSHDASAWSRPPTLQVESRLLQGRHDRPLTLS